MHNIFQNPLHPPVASRHNNMSRKNPPKSRQVLHEIFFNPQWKYKRWAKSIFLKQRPIFLRASSFGEYLNLQYRINKIVSQHSVDYHPSPSRLVLMIHSLIYSDYSLRLLKAYLTPEYLLIFSQTWMFHHGWVNALASQKNSM